MEEELKNEIRKKITDGLLKRLKKSYLHLTWIDDDLVIHIRARRDITYDYRLYNVLFEIMQGRTTDQMVNEVIESYRKVLPKIFIRDEAAAKITSPIV